MKKLSIIMSFLLILILGLSTIASAAPSNNIPLPATANAAAKNTGIGTEIRLDMLSGKQTIFYDGESVITVAESTEENYLRSLATKQGTPYEKSKTLSNTIMRVPDEVLKYKTLSSTSPIDGTSISTVIAVEISYIYSNVTGRALSINGVGSPYIRVAGSSTTASWDGSNPNVTWNDTSIRISYTGSTFVGVSASVGASLGAAGWSFSHSVSGTVYYWSPVVTQVANFYLSQL